MKIFDIDGPFQRYGSILFDLLALNIIWLIITVFSFGILSGPALTGLYSGIYASVVRQEGYAFKEYFKRFKKRFFVSLFLGLILFAFMGISLFNVIMVWTEAFGSIWLLPFYLFVFIEISFISTYAFPLLANSNLKFLDIIKVSFMLANKHLPWTILSSIVNGIAVAIITLIFMGAVQLFLFMFFGMAVIVMINSYLITKRLLTQYDFYVGIE